MTAPGATSNSLSELLKATLEAYKEEHRDLSDTWKQLDAKAQGTVATTGVFLAAAFAFVRSYTEGQVPIAGRWPLAAAILLLVASVVLAVAALRIRKVTAPPLGDTFAKLTSDLLRIEDPEERSGRADDFIGEQTAEWKEANTEVIKENNRKACLVLWSQVVLLLAILCIAGLTSFIIMGWI